MYTHPNRQNTNHLMSQQRVGAEGDLTLGTGVLNHVPSGSSSSDGNKNRLVPDGALYFQDLARIVLPLRQKLLRHPVYAQVDSLARLREFMRIHVFAVWDFMSLVKRLQRETTVARLPWTPPARSSVARFANEVVLGEETDLDPKGEPISHFELYLRAMDEVGAESADVRSFVARMQQGEEWAVVLKELNFPVVISEFVNETLRCAISGSVVEVAAYFFFGREDVIPEMFQKFLDLWSGELSKFHILPFISSVISNWTAIATGLLRRRC